MIKTLALLGLLLTPLNAGIKIKEKETSSLSLDQVKQGTDNNGNINLELIARLKVGNLVSFKLPDRVVIGRVTRVDVVENESIKIIGIFDKEVEAGFGFFFSAKEGKIGGTLSFEDGDLQYKLRFNAEKNFFYFEKIESKKETNG